MKVFDCIKRKYCLISNDICIVLMNSILNLYHYRFFAIKALYNLSTSQQHIDSVCREF
jgi:hypothetical protein